MNSKQLNLFIRIFVLALLMASVPLFFSLPGNSVWLIASVAIAMAIALVALVAASERATAMKTGLPLEDELSRKATWKAGYYAFIIGLWLAIGIMAANLVGGELFKLPDINFRYAFEAMIVLPALAFIVLAMWFKKKGNID
jgi:MFS family permease